MEEPMTTTDRIADCHAEGGVAKEGTLQETSPSSMA